MERVWVTTQLGTAGASRPSNGGPKIDIVKGTEQIDDVRLHATRRWGTTVLLSTLLYTVSFSNNFDEKFSRTLDKSHLES